MRSGNESKRQRRIKSSAIASCTAELLAGAAVGAKGAAWVGRARAKLLTRLCGIKFLGGPNLSSPLHGWSRYDGVREKGIPVWQCDGGISSHFLLVSLCGSR